MRRANLAACAIALAVALAAGAWAPNAAAQGDVGNEPIRITFAAPPGCPDEQAFTGELRARTARARPAWPGEAARTFRVTITRHLGTTLGNLTIEEAGGGSAVREVTGKTCQEVVSALALITALAIDPHALTVAHPSPPNVGEPSVFQPPSPAPAPLPWWVGLPNEIAPARLRLLVGGEGEFGNVPLPLPAWVPPPRAELRGARATAGAQIIAHGGVGPVLQPGGAAFIDLGRRETDVLEPAFRLSLLTVNGGSFVSTAGTAWLHFSAMSLEGCPIQLALETFVRFHPCAGFEVGTIQGQGNGTLAHQNATRPWAAATLIARSEWAIVQHLVVELQGGVDFPFVRDRFVLGGPTTSAAVSAPVYAVPTVGGTVGAGVGVRFP